MEILKNALRVATDEMLLVKGTPVSAGSRITEGASALFDSAAVERLRAAGYAPTLRAAVGEFAIDLMGETASGGACAAELLRTGAADACVCLDVGGSVRRASAQSGLVCVKPTYGSISRYGAVSAVPSGETVSVMASDVGACRELLSVLCGHDERDGTSLSEASCARVSDVGRPVRRVAIPTEMLSLADGAIAERIAEAARRLTACGVTVEHVSAPFLPLSHAAWNTVLCAEVCKATARYDGIRFGRRAQAYGGLEELYSRSRGEGFAPLLKCAILYGSEVLAPENYERLYLRALRARTRVREELSRLLASYDLLLFPATSVTAYGTAELADRPFAAFEENFYTAPASLTGVPAAIAGGVQLLGDAFSEGMLLSAAEMLKGGAAG